MTIVAARMEQQQPARIDLKISYGTRTKNLADLRVDILARFRAMALESIRRKLEL